MFKGNIAVWKSDKNDADRMLAGAKFEIRDVEGKLFDTMTTDADGYAVYVLRRSYRMYSLPCIVYLISAADKRMEPWIAVMLGQSLTC